MGRQAARSAGERLAFIEGMRGLAALYVVLVHNWSPDWMYKINGVLWSIAVESQLYLLFPILVLMLNKANRLSTLMLTISLSASILIIWPKSEKFYPWYLALFTVGMAASHLA